MENIIVGLSGFVLFFACILLIIVVSKKAFSIVTIFEYERGLKYKKGELMGLLKPGQYFCFHINTVIEKIDTRPNSINISGQEILTNDGAPIKVNVAAIYEIIDPIAAVNKTINYYESLYLMLQLSLREVITTLELSEVFEKRNNINTVILEKAALKAEKIGIRLHSADIKDITLVGEMKKVFTQVLQAQKDGQARLERARGEAAALRNLANSAKMLENNPALLQLRILQALGESSGNTIVLNAANDGINMPSK
ncbi:Regulator of protease activity HflC, stomatin/prohibitin superfamily [Natronincola peptidivorans]|uniref:Regulator of protease activity HflC, stomatin/prohibitin superfamily n=1 Tax=Natronincola peptidivorans TaxID=426128 RepID=A0A1I0CJ01_9FIRM|nr:slipin family protein [Natronincola peptidivorans]SET19132.1 Regulator of protease activity HflC, stomatin/prohibitin superfamily [Natronincola peptidivorans]